jgi:transaldolase/glucose-6-phosphate isomerase
LDTLAGILPASLKEVIVNRLKALSELGQSPWLDFISRSLIGPDLDKLLGEDGLGGITSNPAIFEKAIGQSAEYDPQIAALMATGEPGVVEIYEALAIQDIQNAADRLAPVYARSKFHDGYVSLEVAPTLANDTVGTIAEARRLWAEVNRPNLMVKVPGTAAGIPAIETLISEGININVTLLFAEDVYVAVAEAYIRGIAALAAKGGDVSRVASVASFFVSRIDAVVDADLDRRIAAAGNQADRTRLEAIKGKVAIANAKLAYQDYKRLFGSPAWAKLAVAGAQTQRLLWASTGVKNIAYSDVLYCDQLIGADTVNTMPPSTMDAFRDHGTPKLTIEDDLDDAAATMATLAEIGISIDAVAAKLVTDGVQLFVDAFDKLLASVTAKRATFLKVRVNS